jgi:aryl-alcohol dehydrogenase-like predicted oxidoreductase
VTAAIVGGRNSRQVEETAAALSFRVSGDDYARINQFLEASPV